MPFALRPILSTASFYDPSRFANVTKNVTRSAQIFVALDALDFEAGPQTIVLQIKAADDGCYANTAVPCGQVTAATMTLSVTVANVPDAPAVTSIVAPQAGLSARGGDIVDFAGSGLGLLDAPASQLSASIGGAGLLDCKVVERQARVRCSTPPGGAGVGAAGANLSPALNVSGVQATFAPPIAAVSFMTPRVSLPAPAVLNSSEDSVLVLAVDGVPAAALPQLTAHLAGGLRGPTALDPRGPLALNCSAAPPLGTTSPSLTPPDAGLTLACAVPAGGAGAGLDVVVALPGGRSSAAPRVSFAPPAIAAVWTTNSTASAAPAAADDPRATVLFVAGSGLGAAAADLDFVQLSNCASAPQADLSLGAAPRAAAAGCATLLAVGCGLASPGALNCTSLDPRGWGGGWRVRVSVGGALSNWSAGAVSYPAPSIARVAPEVPGAPVDTAGGTLLRISGGGFAPATSLTAVTVGGRAANVSSVALDAAGSGFLGAVLVVAPPGFGTVRVTVAVDGRSASANVSYEEPALTLLNSPQGTLVEATSRFFNALGSGLSYCGLCSAARPAAACSSLNFSALSRCALPDDAAQRQASGVFIDGVPCNVTAFSFSSGSAVPTDTRLTLSTFAINGTLAARIAGRSTPPMEKSLDYDFNRLLTLTPTLLEITIGARPDVPWPSSGGARAMLKLNNAGALGGAITVTPADAGKVLLPGLTITCPVVWSTIFLTLAGNEAQSAAEALRDAGGSRLSFNGTDFSFGATGSEQIRAANTSVYAAGAADRIAFTSNSWQEQAGLPCFVQSWRTDGVIDNADYPNFIEFTTPAWVGSVAVDVLIGGRASRSPLYKSFEPPAVTAVKLAADNSSSLGNTAGEAIVVEGNGFGARETLTSLWSSSFAGWDRANASLPSPLRGATSQVRLSFDSSRQQVQRPCYNVSLWTPTLVLCTAPPGAGGSRNTVSVAINTTSDLLVSAQTASSAYAAATLERASPALGDAAGGFNVTLSGANLANRAVVIPRVTPAPAPAAVPTPTSTASPSSSARPTTSLSPAFSTAAANASLTPSSSSTPVSASAAPSAASAVPTASATPSRIPSSSPVASAATLSSSPSPSSPTPSSSPSASPPSPRPTTPPAFAANAPTGSQFWKAHVFFSGFPRGNKTLPLEGLVRGQDGDAPSSDRELADSEVVDASDSAVVVTMPPFEGRVWLRVAFSSDLGDSLQSTEWVAVEAAAPIITSVSATYIRDDPCALLQRPSSYDSLTQCFGETRTLTKAREVYDWGNYTLPPSTSCFDADYSTFGAPTTLTVRGVNFGTGLSQGTSITLIDKNQTRANCDPPPGMSIIVSGTEARCVLYKSLVSGDVIVNISTAFRNASTASPAVGAPLVHLVAVCPCGMFAIDGEPCQDCPAGASCAGAREPPRAQAGFWDSAGRDWASVSNFTPLLARNESEYLKYARDPEDRAYPRNVDVGAGVPPFIRCAIPDLCKPNLKCKVDKSGEIAAAGFMCVFCNAPSFQRDVKGMCNKCLQDEVEAVRSAVAIAVLFVLALAAAECSGLRRRIRPALRRATSCGLQGQREALQLDSSAEFERAKTALRKAIDDQTKRLRAMRGMDELSSETAAAVAASAAAPPSSIAARLLGCCGLRGSIALEWERRAAKLIASRLHPTLPPAAKIDRDVFERWVLRRILSEDPEKVSVTAMAKLGLNFAQTLGAIANYARPLTAQGGVADKDNALPAVLMSFQGFTDFGVSYSAVKCAFAVKYEQRLVGFMVAPFLSLGLPYLALGGAVLAKRWRLLAGLDFDEAAALDTASLYSMLLTFLVLPASIDTLATAQKCADDSVASYLLVDPELSCKNEDFKKYQTAALVLGYLFLSVPVLVGISIFLATRAKLIAREAAAKAGKALPEPQPVADRVLKTFAFLIKEYDENSAAAHAWETVVLVRKGVFVGLSTGFLVLKSPAAQLVA